MIPALILGRGGSTGLPGKNTMKIMGRPLMSYPINAARAAECISDIYLSTDCPEISEIGQSLGCRIIQRPLELATKEALAEDAFIHGFNEISRITGSQPDKILLLFCNGATVLPEYIEEANEILNTDDAIDSVATASCYNMWSPLRARKLDDSGCITPFINPESFGEQVSCDRGSQGDCWYADCSMFLVRAKCMDSRNGYPPFQWLGQKTKCIKQWGGLDIDYHWQVPIVEHWLKEHGFSESEIPFPLK